MLTSRREFIVLSAGAFCDAGLAFSSSDVTRVAGASIDLKGVWSFRLDDADVGLKEKWQERTLGDSLQLPGSLQEQNFGATPTINTKWIVRLSKSVQARAEHPERFPYWYDDPMYAVYRTPEHFRFPYWLQPKKHYVGAAWYQHEVTIPSTWKNRRILLSLERCHWGSQLWVDDREAGSNMSLATPHEYDLSELLTPGSHRLTIRIDNRMLVDVGANAHSVSDQTQTAWNGVIGKIVMRVTDRVWIDDIQVYPDVIRKTAKIVIGVGNTSGRGSDGVLTLSVRDAHNNAHSKSIEAKFTAGPKAVTRTECEIAVSGDLWNEFSPNLHTLVVRLATTGGQTRYADAHEMTFGMRQFEANGTQFTINGQKVFFRGTLDCCIFPKTGYPPTDYGSWKRVMTIIKSYGLNHVRFHSWCPPEAAFQVADDIGLYLAPEVDTWENVSSPKQQAFLIGESQRILRTYGNHPSFVMLGLGNELTVSAPVMNALLEVWKQDKRRVYTGLANAPESMVPGYDYYIGRAVNGKQVRRLAGLNDIGWLAPIGSSTSADYREAVQSYQKPVIAHETVQICSYPNISDANKYTGLLKADYLEIARDQTQARGLFKQNAAFVQASGRWQVQFFKEEIETALRTPGFGGFQLLSLQDFPGQGAALVGVMDAFWDTKGYITPAEFRRFCSPTVLLARLSKRVFQVNERLTVPVEVAHYGPNNLPPAELHWKVIDGNKKAIRAGRLPAASIVSGQLSGVGQLTIPLEGLIAPEKYTLQIEGLGTSNEWEFWVYPNEAKSDTGKVLVASAFDEKVERHLEQGGTVFLCPLPADLKGNFPQVFSSIYWSSPWAGGTICQTLGILTDPKHPIFEDFPTDSHSNWQWRELLIAARPISLNDWPEEMQPIVQLIDDWNRNWKIGLIVEARVGNGKVLMSPIDVHSDLENRPVARQLRKSLFQYLNSPRFAPTNVVTASQIRSSLRT